jgi:hypothetical protein
MTHMLNRLSSPPAVSGFSANKFNIPVRGYDNDRNPEISSNEQVCDSYCYADAGHLYRMLSCEISGIFVSVFLRIQKN